MNGSEHFNKADDLPILAEIGAELGRLFREQEALKARRPSFYPKLGLRSRAAAAVAVVLVTAGAAAAAVTLSAGPAKPLHVAHGGIQCPPGYPDLTSSQTGLVYPDDYPGSYPATNPGTRCYSSIQAAVADKYKLAPTPTGDVKVGVLYMAPASVGDNRLCARARHAAGATIYCPTMLPALRIHQQNFDCPSTGCAYFTLNAAFSAPDNYQSTSYVGGGEITVWAWSTKQANENPGQEGCLNPKRDGSTTFRGRHAEWLECPIQGGVTPQFNSTDTKVLQWTIGHEQYGVSADGPAGRELATYVAAHLKPEAPVG